MPSLRARTISVAGRYCIASTQRVLRGPRAAGSGSSTVSTRKLARPRLVNSALDGAGDVHRLIGAVGGDRGRVPVGAVDPSLGIRGVEHSERRVGERQHEGHLRPEDAMDLPEHPVDVLHRREAERREGPVDRVGPQEGQLGQRGVVELDLHPLALAGSARVGDLVGGLVDPDDLRTLAGQGDGVVAGAAAEVEDPLALDRAEELEGVLPRDVGPVGDDIRGQLAPAGGGHREPLHGRQSDRAGPPGAVTGATSGRRRRSRRPRRGGGPPRRGTAWRATS